MTKSQSNRDGMGGEERQGKSREGQTGKDDLHRDDDKTRREQNEQNDQGRGSGQQGDRKQEMGSGDKSRSKSDR